MGPQSKPLKMHTALAEINNNLCTADIFLLAAFIITKTISREKQGHALLFW